jgi:hypothetical protein
MRASIIVLATACGGATAPAPASPAAPAAPQKLEAEEVTTKPPNPNDPEAARQQAIEQARAAGILGDADAPKGDAQPETAPAGPLDKDSIRREVRAHIKQVQYCYEKQLLANPTLAGTTLVSFMIVADGHVGASEGSGFDPNVDSCVANVIKDIWFPKPDASGSMQVNYPFTFKPAP